MVPLFIYVRGSKLPFIAPMLNFTFLNPSGTIKCRYHKIKVVLKISSSNDLNTVLKKNQIGRFLIYRDLFFVCMISSPLSTLSILMNAFKSPFLCPLTLN